MQTIRSRRVLLVGVIPLIIIIALAVSYLLTQDTGASGGKRPVTLFMSFIPNVQFAPVYVAVERGYFEAEGIHITLEHSLNEADGIDRLAASDLRFGLVSGEQVLLARAHDRPVVYVFEWYHNFPVGIASPVQLGLTEPGDLAGHIVGIPGQFGASYVGLRALLDAANLEESDLKELRSIGFTAVENICEGQVEAAVIYIVNEPLVIEQQCAEVNVMAVSDYATLISNGLVTNEKTIREDPALVRGMVRALQRGLQDTLDDPDAAFEISVKNYLPDLPEDQYAVQRQVLGNSLSLWRSDDLGQTNAEAWQATQAILLEVGLMDTPLADLSAAYDMDFLPGE
jgi:NitT/TauT family transport system substrate-binding protein